MVIGTRWGACAGVLTGALLIGAWAGCSSSSGSAAPAPVAEAGTDAEVPSDAATPDDAAEAGASNMVGSIFAISDTTAIDGGTRSAYRAGASFRHITSPGSLSTKKTVGPCVIETFGGGDQPTEKAMSAGTVRIEGGLKTVELAPKSDKTYAAASASEALWNGGETLTVRADGKDVPAFMASLTAPSKITLTAPAVAAGDLTVTRSAGVNATFTGMSSGDVVLYFDASGGSAAYSATCTFKTSAGTGQIPAAAFADFPAATGTFDFYVKSDTTAAPPGWDVRFTVTSALVDGSGSALAGRATFQ